MKGVRKPMEIQQRQWSPGKVAWNNAGDDEALLLLVFHVKSVIMGCERNGYATQGKVSCIPLIKANRQQLPGISQETVNNHIASNSNNISNTLLRCSQATRGFRTHSILTVFKLSEDILDILDPAV